MSREALDRMIVWDLVFPPVLVIIVFFGMAIVSYECWSQCRVRGMQASKLLAVCATVLSSISCVLAVVQAIGELWGIASPENVGRVVRYCSGVMAWLVVVTGLAWVGFVCVAICRFLYPILRAGQWRHKTYD